MLPSAHINRVGVRVVCFRSSIAHPSYTPCLRFTESLAVSAQDSGPSGSLILSRKNFAFSASCRFSPALSNIPITLSDPAGRGSECNRLLTSVVLGTQGSSVGSKLVLVIDNHSQTRRRFHVTVRLVTRLVFVFIACSWLLLYLDSVYQRRRAESLVAELKSLDFATAGFPDVRDLTIRNGGMAIQRDSLPRLPDFGTPFPPDLHGNVSFNRSAPNCTRQDCAFELWIMTPLARLPFPLQERTAEFFYSALPYIGVRSWVLYARFEVRNGKLDRSLTAVSELRVDRLGSRQRLVPLGYEVETTVRDSASFDHDCHNQDYRVYLDHGHPVKLPQNMLITCVLQAAGTPTKRAFDINLRCLSGLFLSCRFDELAPSAWADYSAKDGGTGTRNPYR